MLIPNDQASDELREAARTAMMAAAEIVEGLAWTVSGLDFSLPYGFEGKTAVMFAGKLQEFKAGVIRQRVLVIVDALHAAAAVVVQGSWSADPSSRLAKQIDEGLRVVSIEDREATAATGVTKCCYPTIRFAMEAIDRFADLMQTGLGRVSSELSLLDGVDQEQVRDCRSRYEDAAHDLESVLLILKRALSSQIESTERLDHSLASIWTRGVPRQGDQSSR